MSRHPAIISHLLIRNLRTVSASTTLHRSTPKWRNANQRKSSAGPTVRLAKAFAVRGTRNAPGHKQLGRKDCNFSRSAAAGLTHRLKIAGRAALLLTQCSSQNRYRSVRLRQQQRGGFSKFRTAALSFSGCTTVKTRARSLTLPSFIARRFWFLRNQSETEPQRDRLHA